jgi:ELWxxDGT repeat protein
MNRVSTLAVLVVAGCAAQDPERPPADSTSAPLGAITRLGGVISSGIVTVTQASAFQRLPNGTWVWCVEDGPHGLEPWRTDGTVNGTTLLRDLAPGPTVGCRTLAVTNGRALIGGFSGLNTGVWSSDGTSAGTMELRLNGQRLQGELITPTLATRALVVSSSSVLSTDGLTVTALSSDQPIGLYTAFNGNLYFPARPAIGNTLNLWRTDGTQTGTVNLHVYGTGSLPTLEQHLVATTTHVFFTASQSTTVYLYASTGAVGGLSAQLATLDLVPGTRLLTAGNRVYWLQRNPSSGGPLLHTSDGTTVTQLMEVTLTSGQSWSAVERAGQLVFNGDGLWVTNGTVAGTTRVATLPGVQSLVGAGAEVLFRAGSGFNLEFYLSDLTLAGTRTVRSLNASAPTSGSVRGSSATSVFVESGTTLWRFSPSLVTPIFTNPGTLLGTDDSSFFFSSGTLALRLGVDGGTTELSPGGRYSVGRNHARSAPFGNGVIFNARLPDAGQALFTSDGTSGGTVLVPGSQGVLVESPIVTSSGAAWAVTRTGTATTRALQRTDGTRLEVMVGGLPARGSFVPWTLKPFREGVLLEAVSDGGVDAVFVRPDGGTEALVRLATGTGAVGRALFVAEGCAGSFFATNTGALYRSDGTVAGTQSFGSIGVGPARMQAFFAHDGELTAWSSACQPTTTLTRLTPFGRVAVDDGGLRCPASAVPWTQSLSIDGRQHLVATATPPGTVALVTFDGGAGPVRAATRTLSFTNPPVELIPWGQRLAVQRYDGTLLVTRSTGPDEVFSVPWVSPLGEDETSATRDNSDWPRTVLGLSEGLISSVNAGEQGAELGLVAPDGGTLVVADLWPGPWSSNPEDFFVRNGRLFFTAQVSPTERSVFAMDGVALPPAGATWNGLCAPVMGGGAGGGAAGGGSAGGGSAAGGSAAGGSAAGGSAAGGSAAGGSAAGGSAAGGSAAGGSAAGGSAAGGSAAGGSAAGGSAAGGSAAGGSAAGGSAAGGSAAGGSAAGGSAAGGSAAGGSAAGGSAAGGSAGGGSAGGGSAGGGSTSGGSAAGGSGGGSATAGGSGGGGTQQPAGCGCTTGGGDAVGALVLATALLRRRRLSRA